MQSSNDENVVFPFDEIALSLVAAAEIFEQTPKALICFNGAMGIVEHILGERLEMAGNCRWLERTE